MIEISEILTYALKEYVKKLKIEVYFLKLFI